MGFCRVSAAGAQRERQRARCGGAQDAAPIELRRAQSGQIYRAMFTHDDISCAWGWMEAR